MRVRKRQPVHPGGILKRHYLEPLGLNISKVAIALGVSRQKVSNILHEKGSISPDMALRLSRAFDTSPELWMRLQESYNLWYATHYSDEWRQVQKISGNLRQEASYA
jgi:addiction module HigA family antidote